MKRYIRFAFVSLLLVLAAGTQLAAHRAAPAAADQRAWLLMTSRYGSATDLRTISYGGFGADEVLDLTFYDPSGTQVAVGHGTTYYTSTEDDGSGAVPFRPSDWLSPISGGTWTLKAVGETSGVTISLTFSIYSLTND